MILPPETWWTVKEVRLNGPNLYYRPGPPASLREGRHWRRDDRGRVALEAFAALPVENMYAALEKEHQRTRQIGQSPDPRRSLEAISDLEALVRVFGPLGLDANRKFPVEVPEAEEWRRTMLTQRWELAGREPKAAQKYLEMFVHKTQWLVTFPGPEELDLPQVRKYYAYPKESWEERVRRRDEALDYDYVDLRNGGALALAYDSLHKALRLTRALADGSGADVRDCLEDQYPLALDFRRPGRGGDRLALNWLTALRPRAEAPVSPFAAPEKIDWLVLGRIVLAATIDRQLWWTSLRVGLEDRVRFRLAGRIGSLMEVIYLQLLEHVQERLRLGIGTCGYCGGPILNARKHQHWHAAACGSAGRKRRSRAKVVSVASGDT